MAKPKNGCVEGEVAKAQWLKLYSAVGAITDQLGPCERFQGQRVRFSFHQPVTQFQCSKFGNQRHGCF
eukprot:4879394-Alexandrium_andersonii.AAC.1